MVTRTMEQWQALCKKHDDNGGTAHQFCRDNDPCPKCFAKRKKDLDWPNDKTIKRRWVRLRKHEQNVILLTVTLQ